MWVKFQHQKKSLKIIFIIVLVILFLSSLIWFIATVKQVHKSGELKINYGLKRSPDSFKNITNINNIKDWMTFDYINVVYKLDPLYLKNTFLITDSKYPNIRIDYYAKHHNINTQFFLYGVKQTIINYPYNR